MKRRTFIKKTAIASVGAALFPTILPARAVFARSGARKANHVVFCLFAGGVRNIESVHKADGNLMPNTLYGNESISTDIASGMTPLPTPVSTRLQSYGTLFKEFRYSTGATGHYNAHASVITGNYASVSVNINEQPPYPTIFEYYRKHNSPSQTALNAWWVSDSLGPYPKLNYSSDEEYGATYGANMIQPLSIFNLESYNVLSDPILFHATEQEKINLVRNFYNNQFQREANVDFGVRNTQEDNEQIQTWIKDMMEEAATGSHFDPWGAGASAMNGDMYNVFYATKVLDAFTPELMVVNMTNIDVCHNNFTAYCNNIRKADFALLKLWEFIQSHPVLADDTILIAVPEHGRNMEPNTIQDAYGRFALDHTNDETSREIFCLILGPNGVVNQDQVINAVEGQTIDIVPTIANVLGFDVDIPAGRLSGGVLNQAFV